MLLYGRPNNQQDQPTGVHGILPRTWPVTGAVSQARFLLNTEGRVDVNDPGTGVFSPTCRFDGTLGRAKCNVWEPFGYVLHAAEDFYSHSNWADQPNPTKPIGPNNPPGLGHRDLPAFWDLRNASAALPDPQLSTGCYPADECNGRVLHEELNKDTEEINLTTGLVSDPTTPRGKVLDNAQRAVNAAIGEAKRQWTILRWELIRQYGAEKGGKMICALTSDNADKTCNAPKTAAEFAKIPPSYTTLSSMQNPNKCLDLTNYNTTPGTPIQSWHCTATSAQQFQFAGENLQFTSVGSSPAVKVHDKCLDGRGSGILRVRDCNGSPNQHVTVTAAGELKLHGKCISAGSATIGPARLVPCTGAGDQLWQFR